MKEWDTIHKEKWSNVNEEPDPEVVKLIPILMRNGARDVLDLGSGAGRNTLYLAKNGFNVSALDISEVALERLKEKDSSIERVHGGMNSVPLDDSSLDFVLCTRVIQHGIMQEIRTAANEIKRVLRPGGLVFIIVPSTKDPAFSTGREIEKNTKVDIDRPDGNMPHHFFTREDFDDIFPDFEIVALTERDRISTFNENRPTCSWDFLGRKK
ncbi:MAG: class I SAM-dependent methyltransferase [Candidatus Altiarchaeales archaeon]|nr:class I SAM-dependent methyltransferase [Candidatus Altiarchaeota archaeon]MBU4342076.1 class I SAM-dependent methyltransferase [Candidatus Altiarchaeota archaeon]MBU4406179.1 class I SAM-dependent methyltransferase [Candidatus Altiarchaeota archaeon]MBU4436969.1 class I SAM-dependent methyltransferase [Candidatus Altiarchaeota archaeon]MCG2781963.1 class I SAM-dependent methyltransferase [Candidatus Altiarchaeales archaeon]